jgi:hypothetical protein
MWGDVHLKVPTGGTTQSLTAHMGNDSDPGFLYKDGELQHVNLGLSGSFDVYGLKLSGNGGNVDWQRGDNPADDSWLISGTFMVDFATVQTALRLGAGGKPGLEIKDGQFHVESVKFELENAQLGPVTLQDPSATSGTALTPSAST